MARRFGPEDVVIFEQPRSIHLLSLPLWAAHGVNALELARFNPDPDRLRHLVTAWRGRWRNVYFVHTYRTDLCGLFLERLERKDFGTFEWYAYDRKPGPPEFRSLHFTVSRVVPPEELRVPSLDEVDVGGTDDVQVSGFFDKEGGEGRTFRWTGPCASVYLPGHLGRARRSPSRRRRSAGPPRVRPWSPSLSPACRSASSWPVLNGQSTSLSCLPPPARSTRSSVLTFLPGVRRTSCRDRRTPATWASCSTASA